MPPPPLSYGLNIPSSKSKLPPPRNRPPPSLTGQKRKKTIFDSDPEDEDENGEGGTLDGGSGGAGGLESLSTLGGLSTSKPARRASPPRSKKNNTGAPPSRNSTIQQPEKVNLSALRSSTLHSKEAQDIDASIYDYDGVYDSIAAARSSSKKSTTSSTEPSGPKYMTSLLASASQREKDRLRAKDRLLQREREAEGDEFADKEAFVTEAYKKQQEEVRKAEAEEARREAEAEEKRKRSGLSGMGAFYKNILDRDEKVHEEVIRAAQDAQSGNPNAIPSSANTRSETTTEASIAADLNAKGANIILNDDGQVVDKRQLLTAGLNVKPKLKPSTSSTDSPSSKNSTSAQHPTQPSTLPSRAIGSSSSYPSRRARQTEAVAAQLEEIEAKRAKEEAEELARKIEAAKSKKTGEEVQSAKERYLARKAAAAAGKKA